jgi:hypothetical protein
MIKLKRWIRNWLTSDDIQLGHIAEKEPRNYPRAVDTVDSGDNLKFTVTSATGGIIITSNYFDKHRGENKHNIYLIHDDDEVAENITKIITLELLKKQ